MENKLILITGGSASGKTHLSNKLAKLLNNKATLISQDRFYRNGDSDMNYDIPSAFDFEKQNKILKSLLQGKETDVPIYDFVTHSSNGTEKIKPNQFIIFEGIFTLVNKETNKLADFKIFVDTPADTRLSRRIARDVEKRGRDVNSIIDRWLKDVKPSYEKYVAPIKKEADIIIPWHKISERALKSVVVTIAHLGKDIEELLKI